MSSFWSTGYCLYYTIGSWPLVDFIFISLIWTGKSNTLRSTNNNMRKRRLQLLVIWDSSIERDLLYNIRFVEEEKQPKPIWPKKSTEPIWCLCERVQTIV